MFVFLLMPARADGGGESAGDRRPAGALKTAPLDAQLLARAKAQGRANLIRRMVGNRDLAAMLASESATYGDWRGCSPRWTI